MAQPDFAQHGLVCYQAVSGPLCAQTCYALARLSELHNSFAAPSCNESTSNCGMNENDPGLRVSDCFFATNQVCLGHLG